jgi:hypothetical protein
MTTPLMHLMQFADVGGKRYPSMLARLALVRLNGGSETAWAGRPNYAGRAGPCPARIQHTGDHPLPRVPAGVLCLNCGQV